MQSIIDEITTNVNWKHPAVLRAFAAIAFMPIFWNCLARLEYYTKGLTFALGCGNRKLAVYVLACIIFSGSSFRDYLFHLAMESHPPSKFLASLVVIQPAAYALIAIGASFVLSSMWKLGLVGTYLGDYFGILMTSKVESFPFNVVADPMYVGSTMIFLGYSLMSKSWVGLACTLWVFFWYRVAISFEGPFTSMIYEKAAARRTKNASKLD